MHEFFPSSDERENTRLECSVRSLVSLFVFTDCNAFLRRCRHHHHHRRRRQCILISNCCRCTYVYLWHQMFESALNKSLHLFKCRHGIFKDHWLLLIAIIAQISHWATCLRDRYREKEREWKCFWSMGHLHFLKNCRFHLTISYGHWHWAQINTEREHSLPKISSLYILFCLFFF